MGENENIEDKYGFQSTAANEEGSDEDDQVAAPGILKVYKEYKDADEEVDEEINTDDIKYKAAEEETAHFGEKPLI